MILREMIPGDSKWPFYPLVGRHQQPSEFGSLNITIPKKKRWQNCQVGEDSSILGTSSSCLDEKSDFEKSSKNYPTEV